MDVRRFAYADPPYLGNGWRRYYGKGHLASQYSRVTGGHGELVSRLCRDYPDGWALSSSATAVRDLFPLMPVDVHLAVWHRPDAEGFPGQRVYRSWEAVFYRSSVAADESGVDIVRDCYRGVSPRNGFPGAKSHEFAAWVMLLLGVRPHDDVHDLFPGSGEFGRGVEAWRAQRGLWENSVSVQLVLAEPS